MPRKSSWQKLLARPQDCQKSVHRHAKIVHAKPSARHGVAKAKLLTEVAPLGKRQKLVTTARRECTSQPNSNGVKAKRGSSAESSRFAQIVQEVADIAAIRFIVEAGAEAGFAPRGESNQKGIKAPHLSGTGPARLRVLGSVEGLGCTVQDEETWWASSGGSGSSGQGSSKRRRSRTGSRSQHHRVENWDMQYGADLFWEGNAWTSLPIRAPAWEDVSFCVIQILQPESHPGLLLGSRRAEVHASRKFRWSARHVVRAPSPGEVCEVIMDSPACCRRLRPQPPSLRTVPRLLVAPFRQASHPISSKRPPPCVSFQPKAWNPQHAPPAGSQRLFVFDSPNGVQVAFSLYLPPNYRGHRSELAFACVLALHA